VRYAERNIWNFDKGREALIEEEGRVVKGVEEACNISGGVVEPAQQRRAQVEGRRGGPEAEMG